MSTIVVVKKAGFAAVAADSQTTWGSAREAAEHVVNHQKIIAVGNSYLAISGPTSAKLAVKDYFDNTRDADLTNVDAIFRSWLKLHKAMKDRYFINPSENNDDAFESTRIDVLIANPNGIFGVEAHRAVQQFSRYYAYGTGWRYALGAMFAVYSGPERSAEDIARIAIEAAAEFDVDTGLPLLSYAVPLVGD